MATKQTKERIMGLTQFEIELQFYEKWVKGQAKDRIPPFTKYEVNLCATAIMQWENKTNK